jgi:uncharacterized membrane protein YoaK (UPF0700 family)
VASAARVWRLGILSWVAGVVDTFDYLALGRVFISHATGNTAVIAIAVVQRNGHEALRRGLAVPAFFAGSLAGAAVVDAADDSRQLTRALLVEAALIVAFVIVWRLGFDRRATGPAWAGALLLEATAMGIQNAALKHPSTRGTHTTHITGPLSDFALETIRLLRPARRAEFDRLRMARQLARLAGFLAGALSGALLFQAAPITGPAVVAATALASVERA